MQLNNWVEACLNFEEAQAIEYHSEVDEIIDDVRPKVREDFFIIKQGFVYQSTFT